MEIFLNKIANEMLFYDETKTTAIKETLFQILAPNTRNTLT